MKHAESLLLRLVLSFLFFFVSPFIFTYLTVYASYLILLPLGSKLAGDMIIVGGINFQFVEACIASLAYSFIFALVMLTKDMSLKQRVYSLITGWVMIFIVNIVRIATLASIAISYGEDLFKSIDAFIWLIVSGVFVAFVWITLVWLFNIKSIPVYDDFKELFKKSYFSR